MSFRVILSFFVVCTIKKEFVNQDAVVQVGQLEKIAKLLKLILTQLINNSDATIIICNCH